MENEYPDEKENVYICVSKTQTEFEIKDMHMESAHIWGAVVKGLNADKPLTDENNIWI